MPSPHKIFVRDSEGQELFSCSITQRDKAFEYAKDMEELGIDIIIDEPSLPETLAKSLGMKKSEEEKFRQAIDDEIDGHNDCCDS